ncbi:DUF4251 domain-containing protein [Flavobacteriaceae bacterium YJPT1-3]|nr:DUF4251 domain-containing protein [Flavobacteriaceae bacterium YJPT1-3]
MLACSSVPKVSWEESPVQYWLEQRQFEFRADYANPIDQTAALLLRDLNQGIRGDSGGQISLAGSTNYMRFRGDSIFVDLPYFGVRQIGGTYNTDVGIRYEGLMEDFRESENEKKNRKTWQFNLTADGERYQFFLNIYPNKTARLGMNSSERQAINYQGSVYALEDMAETER